MDLIATLTASAVAVFVYVTIGFVVSRILTRNDIADVMWGPGILVAGIFAFVFHEASTPLMWLLTALVTLWGLRLGIRIYRKNAKKKEDPRYIALAKEWGRWFVIRTYFQVFLLQGLLMLVISYPLIHASAFVGGSVPLLAYVGLIIWCIGFFFEARGDYELDAFLAKPENKGRIMRYGLWKYSRHPNYFGEVTMWWGIFLMVVTLPGGLFAVVSPLTITFLILKVSGIPMLEKMFEGNTEFEEYKKNTSAFFPMFPKRP